MNKNKKNSPKHEKKEPEFGTLAYTARMLAELGVMDGDEADAWKDMMKEESMGED